MAKYGPGHSNAVNIGDDYGYLIAESTPSYDVPHMRKFGYNPDVDASTGAPEDIISWGGTAYWIPAAGIAGTVIRIFSDSANDTAEGSGCQSIVIHYLDGDYLEASETVATAGTVVANMTATTVTRVIRIEGASAGSSEHNEGNITIDDGSNILGYIPLLTNGDASTEGTGQSLQCVYTIPANYSKGYLKWVRVMIDPRTTADINIRVKIRPFGGMWKTIDVGGATQDREYYNEFGDQLDPKTDIVIQIYDASANTLKAKGNMWIDLLGDGS